ncbi:DNA-processing protein DprA [Pseudalkalibacillus sp. SCS-8]|uniref:DNA-processing protein DprA n=1 Tax=Pseudalkalibacillus nanhaiensis TaxID=3115291 RepID=UPI0032DBA48D
MLNQVKDRLVYLSSYVGLGRTQMLHLMREDAHLSKVFSMKAEDIMKKYHIHGTKASHIVDERNQEHFLSRIEGYKNEMIQVLTIMDRAYPTLLKEIYDPPLVLYFKGDVKLLSQPLMISSVGTRYPSENGKRSLEKILSPLIESGWTIVSGLAYGIDYLSHKHALQLSGSTIAVLGSGFHHIYPKEHIGMAEEIASKHLLLSEFPPGQKPAKWQFPLRNRIISGLSRGTLIIEARRKSGSLITGDQALQQGREVFAVPGSILEPRSEGTNHLIQQGAKLTTCAQDILDELDCVTANV